MEVNYDTYKSLDFTCKKCGWQGKGEALTDGDFSEECFIGDLECPECFERIAFWQAPLSDDDDDN